MAENTKFVSSEKLGNSTVIHTECFDLPRCPKPYTNTHKNAPSRTYMVVTVGLNGLEMGNYAI